MESVLLVVGTPRGTAWLDRAGRALERTMPRPRAALLRREWSLPELSGGAMWVGPDAPEFEPLIDIHAGDECLSIVFGKQTGERSPARALFDLWQRKGPGWPEAALELDGVFGAIVVDRREQTLTAMTDVTGCRSFVWREREGALLISPHALSILGTGAVPLDWDTTSTASLVAVDWSLGRRPLLRSLRTLKPYERLTWRDGVACVEMASPVDFDSRIDRRDAPALRAQDEKLVGAMVDATRQFARDKERIVVSLTRGLDSRAVLALLHAAGAAPRVATQTSGLPESLDVRGAAQLAAICGLPHHRNVPAPATTEAFEANVRLNAFLNNGEANAKQSLAKPPGLGNSNSVSGGGGEIYTGMYYPLFRFDVAPDDPARVASIFMERVRKGRWTNLGAWDSELRRDAESRLKDELSTFQTLGARGADLVDLLYLWERYAHWGAVTYRRPWAHGWTPFATSRAVRSMFRYPRATGMYCNIHAQVIRDHLPLRAYLMPVNGTAFLPLRTRGRIAYGLRLAQLGLSLAEKSVLTKLRTAAQEAGLEQIWAGMFATEVYDYVHARLTDTASLSVATFGSTVVRQLLETHRKNHSRLQLLGGLVMAEEFRLLAQETLDAP